MDVQPLFIPTECEYPVHRGLGIEKFIRFHALQQYTYYPAKLSVGVGLVMQGNAVHVPPDFKKPITLAKAGDVFVFGIKPIPSFGQAEALDLFVIEMAFPLFYQLSGYVPSIWKEPLFFQERNVFTKLSERLQELSHNEWARFSEAYIIGYLAHSERTPYSQIERTQCACDLLQKHPARGTEWTADKLGITTRQLQRDFQDVLGIAPKTYVNIVRFNSAAGSLQNSSLAETAMHAGYYDQAHMTKEFRSMAGMTPKVFQRNVSMPEVPQGFPKSVWGSSAIMR